MPAGSSQADQTTWEQYAKFLRSYSDRIEKVAGRWEPKIAVLEKQIQRAQSERAVLTAARQLTKVNELYADDSQLANVDLQNWMQKKQQTLATLSNIMKTRHDTVQNIIKSTATSISYVQPQGQRCLTGTIPDHLGLAPKGQSPPTVTVGDDH